jgi:cyclase
MSRRWLQGYLLVTAVAALAACLPAEVFTVLRAPLGDGALFLQGGGGNALIVTAGERALLFDAKLWPFDAEVRRALDEQGARPTLVVLSHLHADHVGTSGLLEGATRVAAPSALRHLSEQGHEALPFGADATLPVRAKSWLRIGGEEVLVVPLPAAHTDSDVAAWFPRRKLLATGDVFMNGYYPHVDPVHGGSMLGLLEALNQLALFDAELVVPGHGPLAKKADLLRCRDALAEILKRIQVLRAQGQSDGAITAALIAADDHTLASFAPVSSREDVVRRMVSESAAKGSVRP